MNTVIEQINSMGATFVEFAGPMLVQSCVLIAILSLPISIPPVKNWWMEITAVFCYNRRYGSKETGPLCLLYTLPSGDSDQISA